MLVCSHIGEFQGSQKLFFSGVNIAYKQGSGDWTILTDADKILILFLFSHSEINNTAFNSQTDMYICKFNNDLHCGEKSLHIQSFVPSWMSCCALEGYLEGWPYFWEGSLLLQVFYSC